MSSSLRSRMTQDLRLRNRAENTTKTDVHCVAAFAKYVGRSPPEVVERGARPRVPALSRGEEESFVDRLQSDGLCASILVRNITRRHCKSCTAPVLG
jgi:hypothetical protein